MPEAEPGCSQAADCGGAERWLPHARLADLPFEVRVLQQDNFCQIGRSADSFVYEMPNASERTLETASHDQMVAPLFDRIAAGVIEPFMYRAARSSSGNIDFSLMAN